MIIPKRILGNLLGRKVKVIFSTDPSLIGVKGIISFETKKMIEVLTSDNRRIFIPKQNSIFEVQFDDVNILIDGKIMARRFRMLRKLGRRR